MQISLEASRKIKGISFVAVVCVLFQHFCIITSGSASDRSIFNALIWKGILDWPVSWFFTVSGFFLARGFSGEIWQWWWAALKKRIASIVSPYCLWIGIGLVVTFFTDEHKVFLIGGLLKDFGIGSAFPVIAPLWYLRSLFVFCVVSPVLLVGCLVVKRFLIVKWAVLCMMVLCVFLPMPAKRILFMPLVFFTLGIMLGMSLIHIRISFVWSFVALCAIMGLIVLNTLGSWTELTFLRYVLDVCMIMVLWSSGLSHGAGMEHTFFIYCAHGVAMVPIYHSLGSIPRGWLCWLIVASCVLFACWGIAEFLKRFATKFYLTLTGGRL